MAENAGLSSSLKSMPPLRRRHLFVNSGPTQNRPSSHRKSPMKVPSIVLSQDTVIEHKLVHSPQRSIKYAETTILDGPDWKSSPGYGLWLLCWTCLGLLSIKTLWINYIRLGYPMNTRILGLMYKDIQLVALTDLIMYLGMYVTFFGQVLVAKDYISWNKHGWILQHVWQMVFLVFSVSFVLYYDFTWIARIFLVLHCLSFVIQQHSYAFYNAHLYDISKELETCLTLYNNEGQLSRDSPECLELAERIAFCTEELELQSKSIKYPNNVTFSNFFMFTMFPIVNYQLEYPRTKSIDWGKFCSKALGVFGIIFLMIQQAEEYLYPTIVEAVKLRNSTDPSVSLNFFELFLDMLMPLAVMFFLVFYLIWDAILNSIAELTYFGDREFYGDWWNSDGWAKFSRDWNIPVYNFLLHHVYYASISKLKMTKLQAKIFTHVLSAVLHELLMYAIFGRLRGFLPLFQMLQLTSGVLFDSQMKDTPVLFSVVFWFSVCFSPSFVASLYLTF